MTRYAIPRSVKGKADSTYIIKRVRADIERQLRETDQDGDDSSVYFGPFLREDSPHATAH